MGAYFDLLMQLTNMFLLMTLFSIPTYYMFYSYGAIADDYMGAIAQFSLGNMGTYLSDQILLFFNKYLSDKL
jgi:hypothetical protein